MVLSWPPDTVDFDAWPLFAAIRDGARNGLVGLHWLGLGIDPLTLQVDMLVVAVFDAQLYDTLFDPVVTINAKGIICGATHPWEPVTGIPLTGKTVAAIVRDQPLHPAGAALLLQTWHHRKTILA